MTILAFGLLFALLLLGAAVLLFVRRWARGGPAKVDWQGGIVRLPQAYLHDVHHVVSRERFAGLMHALTAGGLAGGSRGWCLVLVPSFLPISPLEPSRSPMTDAGGMGAIPSTA